MFTLSCSCVTSDNAPLYSKYLLTMKMWALNLNAYAWQSTLQNEVINWNNKNKAKFAFSFPTSTNPAHIGGKIIKTKMSLSIFPPNKVQDTCMPLKSTGQQMHSPEDVTVFYTVETRWRQLQMRNKSQSAAIQVILYIPCGPAAGQYNRPQRNLLDQLSHRILVVRVHTLRRLSYPPLYAHKQSTREKSG
jgi:hypothetical protein